MAEMLVFIEFLFVIIILNSLKITCLRPHFLRFQNDEINCNVMMSSTQHLSMLIINTLDRLCIYPSSKNYYLEVFLQLTAGKIYENKS